MLGHHQLKPLIEELQHVQGLTIPGIVHMVSEPFIDYESYIKIRRRVYIQISSACFNSKIYNYNWPEMDVFEKLLHKEYSCTFISDKYFL